MNISVVEGSEYFRGLLLLIATDRQLADPEVVLMKRIGHTLGLEKEFCDNAIAEILDNPHVPLHPPSFATPGLAEKFVRDGLRLAAADNVLHEEEDRWLRSAAERNGLTAEWYEAAKGASAGNAHLTEARLELDDLTVEYNRRSSR